MTLSFAAATLAKAQAATPSGVVPRPDSASSDSVVRRVAYPPEEHHRIHGAFKGAGVGFLIGAAAGVVAGYCFESSADAPRDMPGLGYVLMIPAGAVVGTLFGAAIGAIQH